MHGELLLRPRNILRPTFSTVIIHCYYLAAVPLTRSQNDPELEIAADQGGDENRDTSDAISHGLMLLWFTDLMIVTE